MTDYLENVFHLSNYCFVFKRSAVSENQEQNLLIWPILQISNAKNVKYLLT